MSNTVRAPGPRERLLAAATELTYSQGVSVGVDALLKAADVARRSLYEHFGGKDELIAEVLRRTAEDDFGRYAAVLTQQSGTPRERLLSVFDDLQRVVAAPGFRGCRYLAADLALVELAHPAHAVTRDYRKRVHRLLRRELDKHGHPNPKRAADQLWLLVEGVLVAGATRPGAGVAQAARELAALVIDTGAESGGSGDSVRR